MTHVGQRNGLSSAADTLCSTLLAGTPSPPSPMCWRVWRPSDKVQVPRGPPLVHLQVSQEEKPVQEALEPPPLAKKELF